MKVFRFEHKQDKMGMFQCRDIRDYKPKIYNLFTKIQYNLQAAYDDSPESMPTPRSEYLNLLKNSEEERSDDYLTFCQDLETSIFASKSLEQVSNWCDKSTELLDLMLKAGFFLYEIELEKNATEGIYVLESQVMFKRKHIVSKKVIHAKTLLKEFFK